jgi:hypothetical protein
MVISPFRQYENDTCTLSFRCQVSVAALCVRCFSITTLRSYRIHDLQLRLPSRRFVHDADLYVTTLVNILTDKVIERDGYSMGRKSDPASAETAIHLPTSRGSAKPPGGRSHALERRWRISNGPVPPHLDCGRETDFSICARRATSRRWIPNGRRINGSDETRTR